MEFEMVFIGQDERRCGWGWGRRGYFLKKINKKYE
jgi:hypothetical protein